MSTPPPLTTEARAAATARGVAARQLRAEVRAGLAEGQLDVADVLRLGAQRDDRGRMVARMKVADLLASFRGIGPVRAGDIMAAIGIAANRRVGGLGPRQVAELTTFLESRFGGAR